MTRRHGLKVVVAVAFVVIVGTLFWMFRDDVRLESLAARESQFQSWKDAHYAAVLTGAFVLYVSVTGLSLPGAAVLSLTYAWLLGFGPAVILVSFASTAGATLSFLLSRYLFRDLVASRFGTFLDRFNSSLEREGAYFLFTLRLIPYIPFVVINAVMGLTTLNVRAFWWVSQLGMLPGTCVYVWVGASMPSLTELADRGASGILTPQLIGGFTALGVLPIAMKRLVGWWSKRRGRVDIREGE